MVPLLQPAACDAPSAGRAAGIRVLAQQRADQRPGKRELADALGPEQQKRVGQPVPTGEQAFEFSLMPR